MSLEQRRTPNTARVRSYLRGLNLPDGKLPPNTVIAEQTDLSRTQVATVIGLDRRRGGLDAPSTEESRHRRREAQIISRGGKWFSVQPYAQMRMVPHEIELALQLDNVTPLKALSIGRLMRNARNMGEIGRMDEAERLDVHRSVIRASEAQREQSVHLWLGVRDFFTERGIDLDLESRLEWRFLMRELAEMGNLDLDERVVGSERLFQMLTPKQASRLSVLTEVINGNNLNKFITDEFMGKQTLNEKFHKRVMEIITRVDRLQISLTDKERLFRCIFWEEFNDRTYGKFFRVPEQGRWEHLKGLIDGDMDELHALYDDLLLSEEAARKAQKQKQKAMKS